MMVRVGAGEAEAKLMLGARIEGCSAAAYTARVPLTHPLALLHYTSAQGVSCHILVWVVSSRGKIVCVIVSVGRSEAVAKLMLEVKVDGMKCCGLYWPSTINASTGVPASC